MARARITNPWYSLSMGMLPRMSVDGGQSQFIPRGGERFFLGAAEQEPSSLDISRALLEMSRRDLAARAARRGAIGAVTQGRVTGGGAGPGAGYGGAGYGSTRAQRAGEGSLPERERFYAELQRAIDKEKFGAEQDRISHKESLERLGAEISGREKLTGMELGSREKLAEMEQTGMNQRLDQQLGNYAASDAFQGAMERMAAQDALDKMNLASELDTQAQDYQYLTGEIQAREAAISQAQLTPEGRQNWATLAGELRGLRGQMTGVRPQAKIDLMNQWIKKFDESGIANQTVPQLPEVEQFKAGTFIDPDTGIRLQPIVRNGVKSYEPVYDQGGGAGSIEQSSSSWADILQRRTPAAKTRFTDLMKEVDEIYKSEYESAKKKATDEGREPPAMPAVSPADKIRKARELHDQYNEAITEEMRKTDPLYGMSDQQKMLVEHSLFERQATPEEYAAIPKKGPHRKISYEQYVKTRKETRDWFEKNGKIPADVEQQFVAAGAEPWEQGTDESIGEIQKLMRVAKERQPDWTDEQIMDNFGVKVQKYKGELTLDMLRKLPPGTMFISVDGSLQRWNGDKAERVYSEKAEDTPNSLREKLKTEEPYATWYREFVQKYGEEPDLDKGRSQYDYEAAVLAGIKPQRNPADKMMHWPDVSPSGADLKGSRHPNMGMEEFLKETGIDPDTNDAAFREWQRENRPEAFAEWSKRQQGSLEAGGSKTITKQDMAQMYETGKKLLPATREVPADKSELQEGGLYTVFDKEGTPWIGKWDGQRFEVVALHPDPETAGPSPKDRRVKKPELKYIDKPYWYGMGNMK